MQGSIFLVSVGYLSLLTSFVFELRVFALQLPLGLYFRVRFLTTDDMALDDHASDQPRE